MPVTRKKKDEIVIPFLDKHNYSSSTCYPCPNEDVKAWRELIQDLTFDRVAGICSGGEVGFFALLPSVQNELVLVDHSYYSLAYAMCKYAALRKAGPSKVRKTFSGPSSAVTKELLNQRELLPEPVRAHGGRSFTSTYGMNRFWKEQTEKSVKELRDNLDKITFVHGDLTDLEGTFDAIYLSNALEHYDRNHKQPDPTKVVSVVRPGGYVIATAVYGAPKSWKVINSKRTSWTQTLYQLPE